MRPIHVPYDGQPPRVKAGDRVVCADARGEGVDLVALGPARYDDTNAIRGRCYLTVPVARPSDWEGLGEAAPPTNWPAEHVSP